MVNKKQLENEVYKKEIYNILKETTEPLTCKDMFNQISKPLSLPHVATILISLKNENKVQRRVIKGQSYYAINNLRFFWFFFKK